MKKVLFVSALFTVTAASAADLNLNSTAFSNLDLNTPKAELSIPLPVNKNTMKCGYVTGEITQLHLLAQTAKSSLVNHADSEVQFNEFVNMWKPILADYAFDISGTEYKNGFGRINYVSNGYVIRDFIADKLSYNALDPADMAKLQHELIKSLENANMRPIAAYKLNNPIFRPTFVIYYLTEPAEDPAREIHLRHMYGADDIDFDIVENAGLTIIKKDRPDSMAYIGRELGMRAKLSQTEEGARKIVEDFKKFLIQNKKEFIAARTIKLPQPIITPDMNINYVTRLYFFQ